MILASTLTTNLAILVLAGFIGFVVISKVPNTLHTPLMSGTNAIHGIVLLGGLLIVGLSGNGAFNKVILVIAITFGTINIVGGFLVTDRMLEMFKSKPKAIPAGDDERAAKPARSTPAQAQGAQPAHSDGAQPAQAEGAQPAQAAEGGAGDGDAPTRQLDVERGGAAQADGGEGRP